jgi:RNA polymerase sigma-70 factor (ECF subfamily)
VETEILLVEAAQIDPERFGALFEIYYPKILNYAYHRTLDRALAEEITSDTFLKALAAIRSCKQKDKFRAWLFRIATNEIKMTWRAQGNAPALQSVSSLSPETVEFSARENLSAEDKWIQFEQYAAIHQILKSLPFKYQTVLYLRFFNDFSYEEIAEIENIRLGTLKSLLHRGIALLTEAYQCQETSSLPPMKISVSSEVI